MLSAPVEWGRPLSELTSFRIGGPAEAVATVTARDELCTLTRFLRSHGLGFRVIGKGSNLLVADEGYRGVAILLEGEFSKIDRISDLPAVLKVGAGCGLQRLLAHCRRYTLSGLEFCIGIPGSVGGAVIMNAGAWGESFGDAVVSAEVMAGEEVVTYTKNDLAFTYRKTAGLSGDEIVLSATLQLVDGDLAAIKKRQESFLESRDAKQPKGFGNAGSIFKNPPGDSAGRMIDACGLKGERCGDAMISEQHANFIVNCGKAKAADVRRLMERTQKSVLEKFGVVLEPEVHFLC